MFSISRTTGLAIVLAVTAQSTACSPSEGRAATAGATNADDVSDARARRGATAGNSGAANLAAATMRLVVAPDGNEVRYRIREQLARVPLPNDAIGRTRAVTGGVTIGNDGKIVTAESKFVVSVATLASDRDRRDGYVRSRTLQTDQFPTVEFSPTSVRGLPRVLPGSGSHKFNVLGNLTIRGVTRPTTWRVIATRENGGVVGSATTLFTFADFKIDQPRVAIVLSVADTIKLEYDFKLVPKM